MIIEKMFSIVSALADLATLVSIFIAIYVYKSDRKRSNKLATLEAYERLQCEVFDELNLWSPKEIRETIQDRTSDGYKKLSGYLARVERFCAGINEKVYDYDIFYSVANGYFDGEHGMLYVRLIPLIEAKNVNSNKDYFGNIHQVWDKMQKTTENNDRKKVN